MLCTGACPAGIPGEDPSPAGSLMGQQPHQYIWGRPLRVVLPEEQLLGWLKECHTTGKWEPCMNHCQESGRGSGPHLVLIRSSHLLLLVLACIFHIEHASTC